MDSRKSRLEAIVDRTMPKQISALKEQIAFASVKGEAEKGKPFGREIASSLEHALSLADSLGFQTKNLDGYIGIVEYGEGDETLAVMCHLDVVPAGEGWDTDPFTAVEKNGRIFGRGTVDDKGPAISTLFALAAIREAGLPMRRKVRVLLGCDEESGWGCMDYYTAHEPMPELGFSPDSNYPLVYAEKGALHCTFEKKQKGGLSISVGERINVIPGSAQARGAFGVPQGKAILPDGMRGEAQAGMIHVTGRGGHGAMPEEANNALPGLLFALLGVEGLSEEDYETVQFLYSRLCRDYYGEGAGLACVDESGPLTMSFTMLNWDQESVRVGLDVRVPVHTDLEEFKKKFYGMMASGGFVLKDVRELKAHLVPKDSELVKTLLDVYTTYSGEEAEPLATGGATYARTIPNAVAFGCEHPDEVSPAHQPNESVTIEDIRFNTCVIAGAIAALCCEKE